MECFNNLLDAIDHDSTWTPSINVHMPPPSLDFSKSNDDVESYSTDIVPYMKKPDEKLSNTLSALQYPDGCTFLFKGFNTIESLEKLCTYLIGQAKLTSGTVRLV